MNPELSQLEVHCTTQLAVLSNVLSTVLKKQYSVPYSKAVLSTVLKKQYSVPFFNYNCKCTRVMMSQKSMKSTYLLCKLQRVSHIN